MVSQGWKPLLWRKVERAGTVQPEEQEAPGTPYFRLSVFKQNL